MNKNLEKIKKALPELEAKIKEITGAEIKLHARVEMTRGDDEIIIIFSDDLKPQLVTGVAAPVFSEIHIGTRGGTLRENGTICFAPKIEYYHYTGGIHYADYIWQSLHFSIIEEKWLFEKSHLIYEK
jgi:hypothetical protein